MNAKLSFLSLLLPLFLAALFSGTDPSYSCGPGIDYEKYRISYVDPDLLSDSIYQSFYRTLLQEHQSNSYWDVPPEEFRNSGWTVVREEENVRDWGNYFGGEVSARSLRDLLDHSSSTMIEEIITALSEGRNIPVENSITPAESEWDKPDTLYFADALQAIISKKDIPFLRYLQYANECSGYAVSSDPWTEGETTVDTATMLSLIDKGLRLHKECSSEYLKLRYAYQIVRTARYAEQYQRAVALYDELVEKNPTRSSIRYRALGHKAGATRHTGDMPLSSYYFSQVFDSSEGEREIALRDFRSRSDEEWKRIYALAKNDHERATLWMMRGFKMDGLNFSYLRQMLTLEPGSPRLGMALMRELHRIESYLYDDMETRDYANRTTGSFEGYDYEKDMPVTTNIDDNYWHDDYKRHIAKGRAWDTIYYYDLPDESEEGAEPELTHVLSGRDYVMEFRRFVLETAKNGRVAEPALWYMVAGYIDIMDGDYGLADQCLEEAESSTRGNYDLEHQIRLLDLLREAKSKGSVGEDIEKQIAETLAWFHRKQNKNGHTRYDKAMAALGQQYLLQNNVPKAVLAFDAANDEVTRNVLLDMYATNDDLEKLQELVQSGGENDYERSLIDSFSLGRADLLDLRGTRLMRQGNFEEGLTLFQQIPASYWNETPDSNEYGWTPQNYRTFYSSTDTNRFTGMSLVSYNTWGDYNTDSVAHVTRARKYTKLSFAQTAVELRKLAESKGTPGADTAAYRLGTFLFNTPYWGYSEGVWQGAMMMMIRYYYYRATAYPFNLKGVAERMEKAEENFMAEYGGHAKARDYFTRAMEGTKNPELAARCAYMIDLCNKQPQTTLHPVKSIEEQDRTGYNLLMTKYRDTRYAKWVLSQCSIYKLFQKKK